MPDNVLLPPQAARTIEGLRDTGYEPSDALEDIVDNSIAAGATEILIRVWMDPAGEPLVTVADNGCGMDEADLINAMTYGSAARQDPASLGKFGLGLKTASTAMCRQLTVVTRGTGGSATHAATWDLDFVRERNEWLLQRPDPTPEHLELLDEAAAGSSGTLVVWGKVDRLINEYANPVGGPAKNALARRVAQFRASLALTYLRFLRGDSPHQKVRITLNDDEIEPWDPFDSEFGTELLLDQEIPVEIRDASATDSASFRLRAFALPPRSELTRDQRDRAQILTANQGFYVFREGRLLAHGTWLGLRSVEPHFNLSRIEFSFDHRLDEAFQIDIKKSRIQLQRDLQESLRRLVQPPIAEAEERYRKNQRTTAVTTQGDLHSTSNKIIGQNRDRLVTSMVTLDGAGQATIHNSRGQTIVPNISIVASDTPGPHIVVQESLDDGLLWRPTVVGGEHAVAINAGHPFYRRVYLANRDNGTAIQGMNFLLWGLCQAEWAVITEDEKEHMDAVRREVSRVTRLLANELPDVEMEDEPTTAESDT